MDTGTCQAYVTGECNVNCFHCIVQLMVSLFLSLVFSRLCIFLLLHHRCWLMSWTFYIIFFYETVNPTVLVFIKQVIYWCLHFICKFFPPFFSVVFYFKYIIFIHLQAVTIFIDVIFLPLPNTYHILFHAIFWWCVGSYYHNGTGISEGSSPVSFFLFPFDSSGCTKMVLL